MALHLAEGSKNQQVCLVDLDLVNPYFRTREVRELLRENGVRPIVPREMFYSDLPIAGPGIINLIKNEDHLVILDVGGDEMGALALAGLADQIRPFNYQVLMVVNPYRPFTRDVRAIKEMRLGIEASSGLPVHSLLSNPNLGNLTTPQDLLAGNQIVMEAAQAMGLSVKGILVLNDLAAAWDKDKTTLLSIPFFP